MNQVEKEQQFFLKNFQQFFFLFAAPPSPRLPTLRAALATLNSGLFSSMRESANSVRKRNLARNSVGPAASKAEGRGRASYSPEAEGDVYYSRPHRQGSS